MFVPPLHCEYNTKVQKFVGDNCSCCSDKGGCLSEQSRIWLQKVYVVICVIFFAVNACNKKNRLVV